VGLRYNPPPGWPPAPPGFTPPPGWQPDPSWPAPPPGWQLWVNDDQLPPGSLPPHLQQTPQGPESGATPVPPLPGYGAGTGMGAAAYGGGGYGNPGSPYGGRAPSAAYDGLLFPESDAWLSGRRTVSCMIVNPTSTLTSSLLNS
jgi:hypothetical protein